MPMLEGNKSEECVSDVCPKSLEHAGQSAAPALYDLLLADIVVMCVAKEGMPLRALKDLGLVGDKNYRCAAQLPTGLL